MMRRLTSSAPFMGSPLSLFSSYVFTVTSRLVVTLLVSTLFFLDLVGLFFPHFILKRNCFSVFHLENFLFFMMLLYAVSHIEWLHVLQDIFAVFNHVFSGRHPRKNVKILGRFRDWLRLHLQDVADGLVETELYLKRHRILTSLWGCLPENISLNRVALRTSGHILPCVSSLDRCSLGEIRLLGRENIHIFAEQFYSTIVSLCKETVACLIHSAQLNILSFKMQLLLF
jgi:hypothetical protein